MVEGATPRGSDSDDWHTFLFENSGNLPYVARQISEALRVAEDRGRRRGYTDGYADCNRDWISKGSDR
jgi:hypothetical protein